MAEGSAGVTRVQTDTRGVSAERVHLEDAARDFVTTVVAKQEVRGGCTLSD